MNVYFEECSRLYDKYSIKGNKQEYMKKIISGELVDIPFIEMTVTTVCNMKCKACSNLIPYVKKARHFNYEKSIQDLKNLLSNIDRIYRLKVHGGEPLLYPELGRFLSFALKQEKILDIRISTNGSIIPSDDVLSVMKNPKFILHISGYKNLEKSSLKLIKILEENDIRYHYMCDQMWNDLGNYISMRERSEEELQKLIYNCNMRKCTAFYDGKIYVCSRAANRSVIINKEDGVLIKKHLSKKDIYDFYCAKSFDACTYCDGILANSPIIKPAEQIGVSCCD